jgi:hypothetical protein
MSIYTDNNLGTFLIEVAKGNVQGHRPYIKIGHNDNLLVATPDQYIWSPGGVYQWTDTEEIVSFVSDSALDTAAGTGWRIAKITGIGEDFIEKSEFITFNGLTPVNTVNRYIFISNVSAFEIGSSVGSLLVNQGTIIATGNTSGKTFCQVDPKHGINQQLFDCVPAGKNLVIVNFFLTAQKLGGGQAPDLELLTFIQPFGLGITLAREDTIETDTNPQLNLDFPMPFVLPEKSIYWIETATTIDATHADGVATGFMYDI